jgi:hypothetical protein
MIWKIPPADDNWNRNIDPVSLASVQKDETWLIHFSLTRTVMPPTACELNLRLAGSLAGELGYHCSVIPVERSYSSVEGVCRPGCQSCVDEHHDISVCAVNDMHIIFDVPTG